LVIPNRHWRTWTSIQRKACFEGINEEKAIGKFDEPLQTISASPVIRQESFASIHGTGCYLGPAIVIRDSETAPETTADSL